MTALRLASDVCCTVDGQLVTVCINSSPAQQIRSFTFLMGLNCDEVDTSFSR